MANKQVIKGEDIIITVEDKAILHATSHSLKVDLELKSIVTKDTDGEEKYPGNITWSADGDGLVVVDPEILESKSSEDVLAMLLAKKIVGVVIKAKITGLINTYTGKGYITSFSLSTPAGDNATFSYSITGSGSLTPVSPEAKPQ